MFGLSGIKDHLPSTVAGVVALLVTIGYVAPDQATAINQNLPSIINGVVAVVSGVAAIAAFFFKGQDTPAPPAITDSSADKV